MKHIPFLPLFAVVVLIWATASIVRTQPSRELTDPPTAPPRTSFEQRVAAIGLVEPSSESVSMGAQVPGVVEKVHVQVGQKVEKGDVLVEIDTRSLRAELAAREGQIAMGEAQIKVAQAALDDLKRQWEFTRNLVDTRAVSLEEATRRKSAVETAEAQLESARASVRFSEAQRDSIRVDLDRSQIRSPMRGTVLQLKVRVGEAVPAGPTTQPWLTLGQIDPLHLRVDVDEHEAWRVQSGAPAEALVRGNASLKVPLKFVRFEPFVIPKQSLTGGGTERVDTRVLQVIYQIGEHSFPLFVGQQMDVFIEAKSATSVGRVSAPGGER